MLSLLTIIASLLALYLARFPYNLARNYIKARKTGLPIIIVPIDQNHILWMVLSVPLRPIFKVPKSKPKFSYPSVANIHQQKYLPSLIYSRLNLLTYGWEFHVGLEPFLNHSSSSNKNHKTFCLVTCGRTEISTCDPEIAWEIVRRPRDFRVPAVNSLILGKFGANILTSNGEEWAKQRKVVAGVINERISRAVWEESCRQTEGLLGEVYDRADGKVAETNRLFDMMKKITIHVLSGAGMGARVDWQSHAGDEKPREGYRLTYIEACKTVISAVGGPIVLPIWVMQWWPKFLPGHEFLQALAPAMVEFPIHTKYLLHEERARSNSHGGGTKSNIMSQLLQASEKDDAKALSETEMLGNLFIFTAAGFDTTANTLSYALVLLCRYPQWQSWVLEEVDAVLPTDPSEPVDYTAIFPKITRIMAVMLETLRLFTPVIHIARDTQAPQTISTSHGTLQIPADCFTYIDGVALHLDPDIWRDLNPSPSPSPQPDESDSNKNKPDEHFFRPTRWLNPPSSNSSTLFQPPKGSYVPWSAGPRVCPGQKMAQVEFVAIFLTLFRRHAIEVVPLVDGEGREESEGEWKGRLDGLMRDSISVLTLQMKGVYDVGDGGEGLRVRVSRRR
jgi:cytochrome P450